MNIADIKSFVLKYKDKNAKFKFNGARNQTEDFEGKIIGVYKNIFIIESVTDNRIKSFSYSDVLVNNLQIFEE